MAAVRMEVTYLPMAFISAPERGMRSGSSDDEMKKLEESIRAVGILQPIGVVADSDGYRCVWGNRRLVAARALGLKDVPAVVVNVDVGGEERMRYMENRVREEVNPVDEALWMVSVLKRLEVNQSELASMLQMSDGYISGRLSILLWPEEMVRALGNRAISFSVGRELVQIGDETERLRLLHYAIVDGCSARMASEWRREWAGRTGTSAPSSRRPMRTVEEVPWERKLMKCHRCGLEIVRGAARYIEVCGECEMEVKRENAQDGSTEMSGESTSQTLTS